jgi:hypothetical protein
MVAVMGKLTPLSWCIVISTAANLSIAAMVAWFLFARPDVHVSGSVNAYGEMQVTGGTVDIGSIDKDAMLNVQLCEHTSELSDFPLPPNNKREMVPVVHCAGLDSHEQFGFKSYGLSVVPAHSP